MRTIHLWQVDLPPVSVDVPDDVKLDYTEAQRLWVHSAEFDHTYYDVVSFTLTQPEVHHGG